MRATIIRMVLATDLSDHFKYLAELQDAFEIRVGSASGQSQAGRSDGGESAETSGVAGDGGGVGGSSSGGGRRWHRRASQGGDGHPFSFFPGIIKVTGDWLLTGC